jgi:hypothetical protein
VYVEESDGVESVWGLGHDLIKIAEAGGQLTGTAMDILCGKGG